MSKSIAPKVLVLNYDEKNKSPNKDKIVDIIAQITSFEPDIFILTTQDSSSGTSSHIQHSIKEEINNSKKKYIGKYTPTQLSLQKYDLFSKIDATRQSNIDNKGITEKLYNCRTRIWINNQTTYKGFTKKFNESYSKNNYPNYKNDKGVMYNRNYKSSIESEINNIKNDTKIKISKYVYRRITKKGESGKRGDGSIMISLCLEKVDNSSTDIKDKIKTYQYIICNSNLIKYTDIINKNSTKKVLIDFMRDGNVMKYNKPYIAGVIKPYFKGKLFILYVSKDNCVFKKIEDEPGYNLEEVKTINNVNQKKFFDDNLIFMQIENSGEKKSMFSFSSSKTSVSPNLEQINNTKNNTQGSSIKQNNTQINTGESSTEQKYESVPQSNSKELIELKTNIDNIKDLIVIIINKLIKQISDGNLNEKVINNLHIPQIKKDIQLVNYQFVLDELEFYNESLNYLGVKDYNGFNELYDNWKKIKTPSKPFWKSQDTFNKEEIVRKKTIKDFFEKMIVPLKKNTKKSI
jgi:hypothetical protein